MPQDDFYYKAKKKNKPVIAGLTKEEQEQMEYDYESIVNQKEYHRSFHDRWAAAGALYNLTQEANTDDRMSNIYLGLARIMIDHSVGMMTEGNPRFEFDPIGYSDYKKVIIWSSLVEHILNQNNFQSHLRQFIIDLHIFGSSAFEAGTQLPFKQKRIWDADRKTYINETVRDFLRPKVFVRHRPIYNVYRNPNVIDIDDIPTGGYTEELTRNQFVRKYINAKLQDGRLKYKNVNKLEVTSHYRQEYMFDELQDAWRIYSLPYGNKPDGKIESDKQKSRLGIPIFDKPLTRSRYKVKKDGKEVQISTGHNIPGWVPLCFGAFNDQLDPDCKTHSIYGMGIPQIVDGPEAVMQALFNMTIDNMRLKNTPLISYTPKDGMSYPDLDATTYYAGQFIDGDINVQSLGVADVSGNSVMWNWVLDLTTFLTGVNFRSLTGDDAKTAFQAGLRQRTNNLRVRQRLKTLENSCFKRLGFLILSLAMSELTVEEWEALTETEAKEIAKRISDKDPGITAEDYKFEEGRPTERRRLEMIPVKGRKFREVFDKTKTRKLDYNSTENTLIEDNKMEGNVSFVPAVDKYLLPTGSIISILQFDVRVDSSFMLGDMRFQESQGLQRLLLTGQNLVGAGLISQGQDVDFPRMYDKMIEHEGIDPQDVKPGKSESEMLKKAREVEEEMLNLLTSSPKENAEIPTMATGAPVQTEPGGPETETGTPPPTARRIEEVAAGNA